MIILLSSLFPREVKRLVRKQKLLHFSSGRNMYRNRSKFISLGIAGAIASLTLSDVNKINFPVQVLSTTFCNTTLEKKSIKEPKTGIIFPELCNGMQFTGCGVRIKYGILKLYAVGTYMDPIAMSAVKNQGPKDIENALVDPMYPRTIRVVMNRDLSIDKYNAAIVEALRPRMNGHDLECLDKFKEMNPPIDLIEGTVLEMTIHGDTMLYKNCMGVIDQIQSDVFCRALCDIYYGNDPVSPCHKREVLMGVKEL